ncbi:hypothetical protein [Bradyrhizobium liaoningense]|uniref:hypothetical protein n=1 Tax=Bradyrhizobium liaoningense TaxID=43992 RepID=UPI001BAC8946|nr:hypothetical protein [Bradyrhizobium liaoningense]MBR1032725.1 hypothetical protein [Bradyrhizobium liaoningense]
MQKITIMDALKRSLAAGDNDGLTDRQRRKRERTARALAIAFHGDTKEWRGFLTKADAFNKAFASQLSLQQH